MDKIQIINLLSSIKNITINDEKLNKLETYYQFLINQNELFNLTTITKREDVYQKHFFDSLLVFNKLTLNQEKVCDIGSGAGFPGIV
jgi:16S rRNA (guanine527-N7)-methyltransferase